MKFNRLKNNKINKDLIKSKSKRLINYLKDEPLSLEEQKKLNESIINIITVGVLLFFICFIAIKQFWFNLDISPLLNQILTTYLNNNSNGIKFDISLFFFIQATIIGTILKLISQVNLINDFMKIRKYKILVFYGHFCIVNFTIFFFLGLFNYDINSFLQILISLLSFSSQIISTLIFSFITVYISLIIVFKTFDYLYFNPFFEIKMEILYCLTLLHSNENLNDLNVKNKLIYSFKEISNLLNSIPRQLPKTKFSSWTEKEFYSISNEFSNLISWVILPHNDTYLKLIEKLEDYYIIFEEGTLHYLPRPPYSVVKKKNWFNLKYLFKFVTFLIMLCIPILYFSSRKYFNDNLIIDNLFVLMYSLLFLTILRKNFNITIQDLKETMAIIKT